MRSAVKLPYVIMLCGAMGGYCSAVAQTYPARPVRVIVPFPPGGGTDIMARTIAQKLSSAWGQQFLPDNRSGAGGMLGTGLAANAAPDGYTLLVTSSSPLVIGPNLAHKPSYNPLEHLAPIILIGTSPNLLVVHPSLPVSSTGELIALAKRKPGNLDYASSGAGTLSHLTSELFMMHADINMVHIPYKGGPPSVIDLVAGQVSVTFSSFPALWPQVSTGKLRAVAVTSAKRVALAPNLPTVAETIPGFESSQWWGVFAPAAVPKDIISRLNAEMREVLVSDDVKKSLASDAAEPMGGSPLDCANFLRNDYEKWRKVIDKARLR